MSFQQKLENLFTFTKKDESVELNCIVHSGYLAKQSKILQVWKVRWCIINNTWLYTYEDKYDLTYKSPTQRFNLTEYTKNKKKYL